MRPGANKGGLYSSLFQFLIGSMRQKKEKNWVEEIKEVSIPYRFNETVLVCLIVLKLVMFQFLIGSMRLFAIKKKKH